MAITATVAQGAHYDNIDYYEDVTPTFLLSMSADVSFQSSCEYDLGDSDQYDWNKLVGFASPNYLSFSYRSARWAWRWNLANEKVEIAPYVHDESGSAILPPPEQWIQFDLNTTINLSIKIDRPNEKFVFTYVNGSTVISHDVSGSNSLPNGYDGSLDVDLFYFGGNETAPHEMKIDYDNITYVQAGQRYYITGEASGGVTVTGLYPDGSTPYSQYLAMNQTELTPCLKIGSLSTTDVTISLNNTCN